MLLAGKALQKTSITSMFSGFEARSNLGFMARNGGWKILAVNLKANYRQIVWLSNFWSCLKIVDGQIPNN
jgi:hypothetical protein